VLRCGPQAVAAVREGRGPSAPAAGLPEAGRGRLGPGHLERARGVEVGAERVEDRAGGVPGRGGKEEGEGLPVPERQRGRAARHELPGLAPRGAHGRHRDAGAKAGDCPSMRMFQKPREVEDADYRAVLVEFVRPHVAP
jgi:hypothetical protein